MNASSARHWLARLTLAVAILFVGRQMTCAQENISTEYKFKAVFMFHFAQFVDWPTNAFSSAQSPLVIGVLGDDPFDDFLDATVHGENVNGHPLVVERYHDLASVKDCQILFISASEESQLGRVLAGLKGKTILTVSDIDSFPENGGIIGFATIQNKIHFRINTDAARDAGLTFSSKLLRLADIVTPKAK
ncbi:MAG TPA: YfiR family protein [Verrucomicrobiae bacterium]